MCQLGRPSPRLSPASGVRLRGHPPQQRVQCLALAGPARVTAAFGEKFQHLGVGKSGNGQGPSVDRIGSVLPGGLDVVVDVAVGLPAGAGNAVGQAVPQEALDRRNDQAHRLDRTHEVVGGEHPQRVHVLPEQLDLALRQLAPVDADLLARSSRGSSTSVTFST